jgi:capsular polysaccharide biosynthesis protein
MELRDYWHILRRRWWIPAVLVALTALFSLVQMRPWAARAPQYSASLRMLVGVLPAAAADVAAYDPRYYAWLTSEYLVDDFTEVVRSDLFARNVSTRLADQAIEVPPGMIGASAVTGKQHRIITLGFNWSDAAQLEAIAGAAAAELAENAGMYFRQLGTEGAGVTLLDAPVVAPVGPSLRERYELLLRLLLALLVGVGLAFLVDYLDTSVCSAGELEGLGLRMLGEILKHRKGGIKL